MTDASRAADRAAAPDRQPMLMMRTIHSRSRRPTFPEIGGGRLPSGIPLFLPTYGRYAAHATKNPAADLDTARGLNLGGKIPILRWIVQAYFSGTTATRRLFSKTVCARSASTFCRALVNESCGTGVMVGMTIGGPASITLGCGRL